MLRNEASLFIEQFAEILPSSLDDKLWVLAFQASCRPYFVMLSNEDSALLSSLLRFFLVRMLGRSSISAFIILLFCHAERSISVCRAFIEILPSSS
jgi:hypothetical protein